MRTRSRRKRDRLGLIERFSARPERGGIRSWLGPQRSRAAPAGRRGGRRRSRRVRRRDAGRLPVGRCPPDAALRDARTRPCPRPCTGFPAPPTAAASPAAPAPAKRGHDRPAPYRPDVAAVYPPPRPPRTPRPAGLRDRARDGALRTASRWADSVTALRARGTSGRCRPALHRRGARGLGHATSPGRPIGSLRRPPRESPADARALPDYRHGHRCRGERLTPAHDDLHTGCARA